MIVLVLAIVIVVIGVPAGVLSFACYNYWILPHRRLSDLAWLQTASPAELRDNAHRVIRWKGGAHHDAFIYLIHCGNYESVPLLINALRWYPSEGEAMVCTKAHCLKALQTITGHDAGNDYRDWAEWWDAVGGRIPSRPFRAATSEPRP
jgi:hypothetical protein